MATLNKGSHSSLGDFGLGIDCYVSWVAEKIDNSMSSPFYVVDLLLTTFFSPHKILTKVKNWVTS